jgi:hypothetical protein
VTFDRLPENAGAIAISSLCHDFYKGQRKYSDIAVIDAVLFGVVSPAELQRVKIQRLDAREAELQEVVFVDCDIVQLTVDETTRFGRSKPHIHRLLIETEEGDVEEIFEPLSIAAWLDAHSTTAEQDATKINEDAVKLFERVCRVMLRQHVIKEHSSDAWGRYLQSTYWKDIERILFEHDLIDRITKAVAGMGVSFLRMKDPLKILVHRDEAEIRKVWEAISAIPER